VIKEIPVMTTTTGDGRGVAAARAGVLAEALSLGLPEPCYITFNLHSPSEVFGFQFSRYSRDPRGAVHAWADRFGTPVETSMALDEPEQDYLTTSFTVDGVPFRVYAFVSKT
jgi:hypothetical protein